MGLTFCWGSEAVSVLQRGDKPCVSRKGWVGLSSDESDRVTGKASQNTHPLAGTQEK